MGHYGHSQTPGQGQDTGQSYPIYIHGIPGYSGFNLHKPSVYSQSSAYYLLTKITQNACRVKKNC